jgi:hypothetical protein
MQGGILYMGDTSLDTAAAYLAGLMSAWEWDFTYVPSDCPLKEDDLEGGPRLFVFSDYPAARISNDLQRRIVDDVKAGAGLLMIGGWESFHGQGGDWDGTPVGKVLPVEIADSDDRLNCDQPVIVHRVLDHPTVSGLPWDEHPPVIGGQNRVVAKAEATIVLEAQQFDVSVSGDVFRFRPCDRHPLLVVDDIHKGRVAAFTTDVAPHWVGPLVDWGPERVKAKAKGAPEVEVGSLYAQFLKQLLEWVGGSS